MITFPISLPIHHDSGIYKVVESSGLEAGTIRAPMPGRKVSVTISHGGQWGSPSLSPSLSLSLSLLGTNGSL